MRTESHADGVGIFLCSGVYRYKNILYHGIS